MKPNLALILAFNFMTEQLKHICQGISIIYYFGKNGTAQPYLSGASCDTERTGCEAWIWSRDRSWVSYRSRTFAWLVRTWVSYRSWTRDYGHVTRQSWGLRPLWVSSPPRRGLLTECPIYGSYYLINVNIFPISLINRHFCTKTRIWCPNILWLALSRLTYHLDAFLK